MYRAKLTIAGMPLRKHTCYSADIYLLIFRTVPAAALCFLGIVFQQLHVIFDILAVYLGIQIDNFLVQIVEPGRGEAELFQRRVTQVVIVSYVAVVVGNTGRNALVGHIKGLEEGVGMQAEVTAIPAAGVAFRTDSFAEFLYRQTVELFRMILGRDAAEGYLHGTLEDPAAGTINVYSAMNTLNPADWSDADFDTLCAMQERVNDLIGQLTEDERFTK